MNNNELFLAILILSIANIITRALPFVFFANKKPPSFIIFIEKNFPPIIMTILIFYTLANVDFIKAPYGAPEIFSILLTGLIHIKFNNFLISIASGTIFYMMFIQFVS